jgi:hypothetical protein
MLDALMLSFAIVFASPGPPGCVPGQQVSCACPGRTEGVQVCTPEGDRFGPCACGDEAPASRPRTPPAAPPVTTTAYADRSKEVQYVEGAPAPVGYRLEMRRRWDLVLDGAAIAGACYLSTGFIAALIDAGNPTTTVHRWMYLPIAGPFITAGLSGNAGAAFLLIVDGLVQAVGAGFALYGAVSHEKYWLRDDVAIAPLIDAQGTRGLALSLNF